MKLPLPKEQSLLHLPDPMSAGPDLAALGQHVTGLITAFVVAGTGLWTQDLYLKPQMQTTFCREENDVETRFFNLPGGACDSSCAHLEGPTPQTIIEVLGPKS